MKSNFKPRSLIIFSLLGLLLSACGGGNTPAVTETKKTVATTSDGELSVSHAPTQVAGSFNAWKDVTKVTNAPGILMTVAWGEIPTIGSHLEAVLLAYVPLSNMKALVFVIESNEEKIEWSCEDGPAMVNPCSGISINFANGTVSINDQVMTSDHASSPSPVTLNGTLQYTPPGS